MRIAVICAAVVLSSACSSSSSPPARDTGPDIPAGCNLPVVVSSVPGAQVLQLGTHTVGEELTFAVPAGTQSVTILQQQKTGNIHIVYQNQVLDNSAVPLTIKEPDGGVIYNDNVPSPSSEDGGQDYSARLAAYGQDSPVTAAFTVPNTTGALGEMGTAVPSGTWKFTVNDYAYECSGPGSGCTDGGSASNTYDVSVVLKPAATTSNVDVAIYLATSKLTAATAASDPSVKRFVSSYKSLLAAGGSGLTVRSVTFYDLSASDVARYSVINDSDTGPCSSLDQLFTLSSAHPGNTVNLFFVDSINSGGQSTVGIDGAIPGPAGIAGTVHSGAIVSMANLVGSVCAGAIDVACGADEVAYIAAHETGHYLGLFHTTESDGAFFDPILDTPKCPCLSCAAVADQPNCTPNATTRPKLDASQCVVSSACGGGDNLMFWILQGGVSTGKLSPQQIQVMQKSPFAQ